MTTPIIIDTDPGIDDALALMLAAGSPEVKLLGAVAVNGNVGIEHTVANLAAIADLLQLTCPIGKGASGPLWRTDRVAAADVHGANGLGGYVLPESDRPIEPGVPLLTRLIEQSAEPVTIVAIGPLTDIALLMTESPATAKRIERLVLMGGGTLHAPGNVTAAAEFNMYVDPEAAARVFAFGVPITMVGLNVTNGALVGREHLPGLFASGGQIAAMVGHLLDSSHDQDGQMAQHDSLALASVILPDLLVTRRLHVDVENVGRATAGMTVVDFRERTGANCDVAFGVDLDRFRMLLDTRLTALDGRLQ